MTNDERLAIAEEVVKHAFGRSHLGDVVLVGWEHPAANFDVLRDAPGNAYILRDQIDPIEAIYLARQKLAAEREAKKSPRERRLEVILRRMVETVEGAHLHYMLAGVSVKDAKEALKED